jgi:hypothetical protein
MFKKACVILKGLESLEGFSIVLRTKEAGTHKQKLRKLIASEVNGWKKGRVKWEDVKIVEEMPTDSKTIIFTLHSGTPMLHKIIL